MSEVVFQGGTILTIDPQHRVLAGDVGAINGAIVHVGGPYTPRTRDYEIVDCHGCIVMPGLVQAHVQTWQTLARGRADGLSRQDAQRDVLGPYEAALDEDAARAAAELLAAPDRPTAVLCFSDAIAIGVVDAARDAGLRVPDDLSVVGFDDIPMARRMRPALTTVHQDAAEKGRVAAAELAAAVARHRAGHEPVVRRIVLPTELVVRHSTAPPSA